MPTQQRPARFKSKMMQRLAPGQKLVGRSTRWGNPFLVDGKVRSGKLPKLTIAYAEKNGVAPESLICSSDQQAVDRFRAALLADELGYTVEDVKKQLRGYELGCPCGQPACHADVLIEIANP